jgi:hypothetical protein
MPTTIKITPPNGVQETIEAYENCTVNTSITDRAGSFSLVLPFRFDEDISRFVVGTDVQIDKNGHDFRGWDIKPEEKYIEYYNAVMDLLENVPKRIL